MTKLPKGFFFKVLGLAGFFLLTGTANAVPPPPALAELCKNSDMIVKGEYIGGTVSAVKNCQFWVTFQVKPEKFYKTPSSGEDLKLIQFRKRYFEDIQGCANIPGPNAMPSDITAQLTKPTHEKKIFFLKSSQGQIKDLSDTFWGIMDWNQAPEQWHKEFTESPSCHP